MARYIIIRCLQAIVVLAGITTAVFIILNLTGDPAALMLPEWATNDDYNELKKRLGLDQPLFLQYIGYLKRAVLFDFGFSFRQQQSAISLVLDRMPATIELAFVAFIIALTISLPTGMLSAIKRDSSADFAVRFVALIGQSMPNFWLGLMLILLFSLGLDLLPTSGRLPANFGSKAFTQFYLFEGLLTLNGDLFWNALKHVILPGITAGLYSSARLTRMVRSSMIDVLGEDYIRTARAKGLSEWVVIWSHSLKNAAIPIVTVAGLELGLLLGGTVVTETVFAWPGVGLLTIQALQQDDFPVIQAAVFFLAFIFVFVNLVVDLIYGWLDPRIRYD